MLASEYNYDGSRGAVTRPRRSAIMPVRMPPSIIPAIWIDSSFSPARQLSSAESKFLRRRNAVHVEQERSNVPQKAQTGGRTAMLKGEWYFKGYWFGFPVSSFVFVC